MAPPNCDIEGHSSWSLSLPDRGPGLNPFRALEPSCELRTCPHPPAGPAYLGPQVRGRRAQGDRAGALAAAQGHPEICPALVGDTHRAAGESFPGAPAEHGRAPPARSVVCLSVRTAARRAGRLGGHPWRPVAWLSPPRSPRLAPECTPPPPPFPVPLALPPAGPSLSPDIPPPSAASPHSPPALSIPPQHPAVPTFSLYLLLSRPTGANSGPAPGPAPPPKAVPSPCLRS